MSPTNVKTFYNYPQIQSCEQKRSGESCRDVSDIESQENVFLVKDG